jgi:hypothetical protein
MNMEISVRSFAPKLALKTYLIRAPSTYSSFESCAMGFEFWICLSINISLFQRSIVQFGDLS